MYGVLNMLVDVFYRGFCCFHHDYRYRYETPTSFLLSEQMDGSECKMSGDNCSSLVTI